MAKDRFDKILHGYFPFGFHISQKAWEWLDIEALSGDSSSGEPASDIYLVRKLADRFNHKFFSDSHAGSYISEGQLISLGVVEDVLRYVAWSYCDEQIPDVLKRGLEWTTRERGRTIIEQPVSSFSKVFPPHQIVKDDEDGAPDVGEVGEVSSREMALLHLAMINPALKPFREFFDDEDLKVHSPYVPLVESLESFFESQPVFKPVGWPLFKCLRAPMLASPDSLEGQLVYIKEHWIDFLPEELIRRLLVATDILKEENLRRGIGPGESFVLEFLEEFYDEPARFSKDADWMSNVVLIAKSVHVWLDQLSKKYQRNIRRLDEIPDEELDLLAKWGFSGLWLIGLWERSRASQTIKQIMGNPEAASSAYSIYDYTIANDLGGEEAHRNLRERCRKRGIRLASDMVPNHMGIYSKWMIEHPDRFIQLDCPPYPGYQFTGVDLSDDERVTVQIEDGYWQHRDAAVVFKRIDQWTGDATYIYHGNDGTSMPWNDTAQLDFTLANVREEVIQTILHVAREFSIIRFDAAMTLAKKHYQRLWFPQHGHGGAIPSRSEHGMSRAEFDKVFPAEFWREVVDRVAAEAPDTLLLAEAFWLMEGYFVRTLGMHRVYNSAFMNMLKMEDNSKYRMTVKNVLEFSPEVLKRFVNFMNNPDEATAVEQFGRGDKYFGVAVMLVTMPGLPMFGHGQIEGFSEKYGMEYYRAYWDEHVDEGMVRRHESEIFPLMRRRRLFSGVDNFALYDFNTSAGWVDENVFAYSNKAGNERGVILYNNAYNKTKGWIGRATTINRGVDGEDRFVRPTLAEALGLNTGENIFYTFRDHQARLEYIRSASSIASKGLYAELNAYQYHAFLDFREVYDSDGRWRELAQRLNGQGVPNINIAYRELVLGPVLGPFKEVVNSRFLTGEIEDRTKELPRFKQSMTRFLDAAADYAGADSCPEEILNEMLGELELVPLKKKIGKLDIEKKLREKLLSMVNGSAPASLDHVAIAWSVVHQVGKIRAENDKTGPVELSCSRLGEWLLGRAVAGSFQSITGDKVNVYFDTILVEILTKYSGLLESLCTGPTGKVLQEALSDQLLQKYLNVNRHKGVLWLSKEQLQRMVGAMLFVGVIELNSSKKLTNKKLSQILQLASQILDAADKAGYQVDKTIDFLAIMA
jgi:glycosidase